MQNAIERLNQNIDAILATGPGAPFLHSFGRSGQTTDADDIDLAEFTSIATELRDLPRSSFRESLGAALRAQAAMQAEAARLVLVKPAPADEILPSLFHSVDDERTNPRGFAMSLAAHAAMAALVLTSGLWMVKHKEIAANTTTATELVSPYVLPPAKNVLSGGGGGGDHDKFAAPQGHLPKFTLNQVTPPAMVIRNENPKLPSEASVVMPPNVQLPQVAAPTLGDPASKYTVASNGTGLGSGIGSGNGGGVGSGTGGGIGPGTGGGYGGGVFHIGGGVSAPRAVYDPDPEYSEEARKAKYQGTVTLSLVVDQAGRPSNIHVIRSLGMGLDEKAIEKVKTWKFEPAMKDGHPVAVQVNLEVNFHLY